MKPVSLYNDIASTSYPGRGIVIGKSADGSKAVIAYFIMGRSENSRNRVFAETEDGIKTQAFDPSKLVDPSLIIYSPVRVLGNKTIVTNGDQTDTVYDLMNEVRHLNSHSQQESLSLTVLTTLHEFQVLLSAKTAR